MIIEGQWNGSADKGAFLKMWWAEFDPPNIYDEKRERTASTYH